MRKSIHLGMLVFLLGDISRAQSGISDGTSGVASRPDVGDRAWAALTALRQGATTQSPTSPGVTTAAPLTPAMPAQEVARKAANALNNRQTAVAAKDFYTRFPTHAQAPAARKLEALASIAGINDDDKAHEIVALKTAGDFRANKANPISDRYEVAHTVERFQVGRKLGGKSWLSAPFEAEALADRLRVEFGHLPEVYGNYLNVAQHTHCDHSRDVARRILLMPAPAYVKAAAQRVFERANLMRKPIDFPLATTEGKATRLTALAGSRAGARTVVVFWDGVRVPAGPPGLHPYVKHAPPNANWVYVSLGAWTPPPKATKGAVSDSAGNASANATGNGVATTKAATSRVKASAAPPGTYCVEPLGLRSAVAKQLKISSLPFVCVLDDKKNLNAFGRVDEIPALLAGINRVFEP